MAVFQHDSGAITQGVGIAATDGEAKDFVNAIVVQRLGIVEVLQWAELRLVDLTYDA
jgi:hypothetical protein